MNTTWTATAMALAASEVRTTEDLGEEAKHTGPRVCHRVDASAVLTNG
jgi:hypothetical protein